MNGHAGGIPLV